MRIALHAAPVNLQNTTFLGGGGREEGGGRREEGGGGRGEGGERRVQSVSVNTNSSKRQV